MSTSTNDSSLDEEEPMTMVIADDTTFTFPSYAYIRPSIRPQVHSSLQLATPTFVPSYAYICHYNQPRIHSFLHINLLDGSKFFNKGIMEFLMDEGFDVSMKGNIPKANNITILSVCFNYTSSFARFSYSECGSAHFTRSCHRGVCCVNVALMSTLPMCCVHEYMVQKIGVLGADMKY